MKIFKLIVLLSFVYCLLSITPKADAAVKTWNPAGCGSTSWNTGANWSGGLPGTSDVATFDGSTSNCPVTVDTSVDVDGINITNSYTGTITQGNGNDINIRASGYTQNASGSTFTGGDATSDITLDSNGGDFALTSGTFNAPAGTLFAKDDWTISGGTFTATSGIVEFDANDGAATITGTATFYNLQFVHDSCPAGTITITVASGTILTSNGTFQIDFNSCHAFFLAGPGEVYAKGNLETLRDLGGGDNVSGTLVVRVNGTGNQTMSGSGSNSARSFPAIVIDKPSGTLTLSGYFMITDDFTYVRGNVDPGDSTVSFAAKGDGTQTITGSLILDNVFFLQDDCSDYPVHTIASGTTITAKGDLTLDSEACHNLQVDGPGALNVEGNFSQVQAHGDDMLGSVPITFTGTNNQTWSQPSRTTDIAMTGNYTINKTGGTVTLSSDVSIDEAGQDLIISAGVLNVGNYDLTVGDLVTVSSQLNQLIGDITFGGMSLGTKGIWQNNSTGAVTVGTSGVSNSGYIHFDGSGPMCGQSDSILLRSSSDGTARAWMGSGSYYISDVDVKDQIGGSIGTNSNNTSAGTIVTSSFPATSGDLLVAMVSWGSGSGATVTMSDSVGSNTWNTAVAKQVDGRQSQAMQMFYAYNITGSSSMTVTATFSSNSVYRRIIVFGVKNIQTSSDPLDKNAHSETQTGPAVSVGPITPATDGQYIVATSINGGSNSYAADSPFTEEATIGAGDAEMEAMDYTQPTAGAITPSWTMSGSNVAMTQVASFKNNGGTPAIRSGGMTAYSSTATGNSDWIFNPGCPEYSNRSVSNVTGGASFTGGTSFTSN